MAASGAADGDRGGAPRVGVGDGREEGGESRGPVDPPALSSAGVPRTPLLRSPPTGGASSNGSLRLRREDVYICIFSLQRRKYASRVASAVGEGAASAQCGREMHFAFAFTDASPLGLRASHFAGRWLGTRAGWWWPPLLLTAWPMEGCAVRLRRPPPAFCFSPARLSLLYHGSSPPAPRPPLYLLLQTYSQIVQPVREQRPSR